MDHRLPLLSIINQSERKESCDERQRYRKRTSVRSQDGFKIYQQKILLLFLDQVMILVGSEGFLPAKKVYGFDDTCFSLSVIANNHVEVSVWLNQNIIYVSK